MEGIRVNRVVLYPSHDKSASRRILNYFSFAISSFLLGPWMVRRPDVIYVYNLVTLAPTAFLIRFFFRCKVILDVQDLWPESVANSRMLGCLAMLNLLNGICGWVYRKADQLVVLSPGFKQELVNRGVAPDKVEVIYNWCDESSIQTDVSPTDSTKPLEFSGKFVVLFAGTMGIAQGLDTVLDCARLSRETLPNVLFVLIGGGVDRPRLQQRAEEIGLDNVTFLPLRPMETMGEIFALADALIVHLKDDPLFRITIPSKTQAYLYMGKPIIMAVRGDAAALVDQAGAGYLCEPDNPLAMLGAVKSLHDTSESERRRMGDAGHCYYMQHLSFEKGVRNFEQVLCSLIDPIGKAESDAKTS
jgi:glycosyltransferase involved in cell wall biosynthesis